MKMIDRIWKFIKENWLILLGIFGGVISTINFLDRKQSVDVKLNKQKTEREEIEAREEEQRKIAAAKELAAVERQVRDLQIKQEANDKLEKIDQEVKEKIETNIDDASALASDFASTFGGTYVKKNDE